MNNIMQPTHDIFLWNKNSLQKIIVFVEKDIFMEKINLCREKNVCILCEKQSYCGSKFLFVEINDSLQK